MLPNRRQVYEKWQNKIKIKIKMAIQEKISKMPSLQKKFANRKTKTAKTVEKKMKMLKKTFFLPPSNVDFSDLKNFVYSTSMTCAMTVTKQNTFAIIKRPRSDKISKSNGITNKIFQTNAIILIKLLISMF